MSHSGCGSVKILVVPTGVSTTIEIRLWIGGLEGVGIYIYVYIYVYIYGGCQ
jgi:hypothetical protein